MQRRVSPREPLLGCRTESYGLGFVAARAAMDTRSA